MISDIAVYFFIFFIFLLSIRVQFWRWRLGCCTLPLLLVAAYRAVACLQQLHLFVVRDGSIVKNSIMSSFCAGASAAGSAALQADLPARPPPEVQLSLYQGASAYRLTTLHGVYSIEQDRRSDDRCMAFTWSEAGEWLAVAASVDGVRVPFSGSDHVTMRVLDERDRDEGVALIGERVSTRAWSDGFHYFAAPAWRKVGEYRVVFALSARRAAWRAAGVKVRPLSFSVRVEDPAYEAELIQLVRSRLQALAAKDDRALRRNMEYPGAPLSKRER